MRKLRSKLLKPEEQDKLLQYKSAQKECPRAYILRQTSNPFAKLNYRARKNENARAYRMRKTQEIATQNTENKNNIKNENEGFNTISAKSKAIKKVKHDLPKTKNKIIEVLQSISEDYNINPGVLNQNPIESYRNFFHEIEILVQDFSLSD